MNRSAVCVIAAVLTWMLAPACLAEDFYIEASRTAIVRQQPDGDSDSIVRLERGDTALCLADPNDDQPLQVESFYRIRLRDGRFGWVSRYVVRAFEGSLPEIVPDLSTSPIEALAHDLHLELGAPRGHVVLYNEGYVVGYDPRLRIPAWVQYRVTKGQLASPHPRSDAFAADTRVEEEARAELIDYDIAGDWAPWEDAGLLPERNPNDRGPMYARGHLAPARDLAFDVDVEESSYLLSNMAPQVHAGFNSGIWSSLERKVREWATVRGDLIVITGPVFLTSDSILEPRIAEADRLAQASESIVFAQPPTGRQVIYNVVGTRNVAVPTAFFKVIVDVSDRSQPEAIAFLVPHYRNPDDRSSTERLAEMIVSIDRIEQLTGLDLLSGLSETIETPLEVAPAANVWSSTQ